MNYPCSVWPVGFKAQIAMISPVGGGSNPGSYGFENLVRIDAQSSIRGSSRADNSLDAEKRSDNQPNQLTPEQLRQVDELKKRDREVREHEQAHLAVGRDLVRGGPTYSYETGPDNKRYVVSGEVSIDSTPGRTPEETIPKAQHIRDTALAPAQPSAQDRSVAAQAGRMESDARIELANQQSDSATESGVARLYGGVGESNSQSPGLGERLDLFA